MERYKGGTNSMNAGIVRGIQLLSVTLRPILLAAVFLGGCAQNNTSGSSVPAEEPQQVIEHFAMVDTSLGIKNWELKADKASIFELKEYVELDMPELTFYESGLESTVVKSVKGYVDRKSNIIKLEDDVVVDSKKDKTILKTQELFYDMESKKTYSQKRVEIIRPNSTTVGAGFQSDSSFSKIVIKDNETIVEN